MAKSKSVEVYELYTPFTSNIALDRDAAVATVTCLVEGQLVTATGSSRRSPDDKFDKRIATLLAYSRAYDSLAAKLKRRSEGYIKHNENISLQRPEQIEKNVKWHLENEGKQLQKKKKAAKSKKKIAKAKAKLTEKTIKVPSPAVADRRVGAKRSQMADCV